MEEEESPGLLGDVCVMAPPTAALAVIVFLAPARRVFGLK